MPAPPASNRSAGLCDHHVIFERGGDLGGHAKLVLQCKIVALGIAVIFDQIALEIIAVHQDLRHFSVNHCFTDITLEHFEKIAPPLLLASRNPAVQPLSGQENVIPFIIQAVAICVVENEGVIVSVAVSPSTVSGPRLVNSQNPLASATNSISFPLP